MANENRTYPLELTADAVAEIRKIIGEDVIEESKLITANGVYDHLEVGAYAKVKVNVQPNIKYSGTFEITENGITPITDIVTQEVGETETTFEGPINVKVAIPFSNYLVPEDLQLTTKLNETSLVATAFLDKDAYKNEYRTTATVDLHDTIEHYIHDHSAEIFEYADMHALAKKKIESYTTAETAKAINVQFQPNPDSDKDIFVEACLTDGKSGSEHFDIKLTVEDFIEQLDKCGYRCYKKA